jgi:predicted Rossmann fold flavoprotein
VIIGGGAAGMFAAIHLAPTGQKIALLEGSGRLGRKILISGGGNCNFTNIFADDPRRYICSQKGFTKKVLRQYPVRETIGYFSRHGVRYTERPLGKLFSDIDGAKAITGALLRDLQSPNLAIHKTFKVAEVQFTNNRYTLTSESGDVISGRQLLVSSGGLSIPKAGATDIGYRIARQFGHSIKVVAPALVPLVAGTADKSWMGALSGVSVPAKLSCNKQHFNENLLFTHDGISGPGVLQISSFWQPGQNILIDFLPDAPVATLLERQKNSKQLVANLLATVLPLRLAQSLVHRSKIKGNLANLSNRQREQLHNLVHRFQFNPDRSRGYTRAEVTRGGVNTTEIDPNSMASTLHPGLYFAGEVIDVTGRLGGYNLQWAWASGYVAARSMKP